MIVLSRYDLDNKDKKWQDLKSAVGTMVSQRKTGVNMSLDELLLNVKAVNFASLVCQSQIQTEEDKASYISQGYDILLTAEELREKLDLDPACVWYSKSISNRTMYFNENTLAAAPLHLELMLSGLYLDMTKGFYEVLKGREKEVAAGDYLGSITALPDAMQMKYFNLLVDKKGPDISGLYDLFFTAYLHSDYGFSGVAPHVMDAILNAKTDEDRAKTEEGLKDLPDKITIYRGGNTASTPYSEAFSWTLDKNIANFFACRRGCGEGYIVEAEVDKKDIIDVFLTDRNEQEVLVHPDKVKVFNETPIHGIDYLESVLPEIALMYQQYKEQLLDLTFAQSSQEHGLDHEARVLLLSLVIANEMDLPLRDRRILATAAIFHDTQRVNDIDDLEHGKAAREYYHAITKDPDPFVEFLCEYHSRPDEEGYQEILNNRKLSKSRSRSKLLFDIFKDADALERVRFGIKALDIHQLRLPVSQELTLVARLFNENVKSLGLPKVAKPSLSDQIQAAAQKTHASDCSVHSRELDR